MRNHNTTLNTIFMTFKHSLSNKILAYFTPSSMKGIFSLSFIWHFLQETRRKSRKQVKITWLSKSLKFLKIHWRHRILMPDSRNQEWLQCYRWLLFSWVFTGEKSNNLKQGIFLRPKRKRDKLHRREARDKITRGRSSLSTVLLLLFNKTWAEAVNSRFLTSWHL